MADEKPGLSPETIDTIKSDLLFGVGYKRPPPSGHFRKGQSGNPNGRPRKAATATPAPVLSSLAEAHLQESRRLLTIREGDASRQVTTRRAIILAQQKSALQGNPYAQRNYLDRAERYEREERAAIAENHAFWRTYEKEARKRLADGEPVDQVLPHPDDLIFPPDGRVHVRGPATSQELEKARREAAIRDAALLELSLDMRDRNWDREVAAGRMSLFGILMDAINKTLPARTRVTDKEMFVRVTARPKTKHVLRQELGRTWRKLGHPRLSKIVKRFVEVDLIEKKLDDIVKAVEIAQREMERREM